MMKSRTGQVLDEYQRPVPGASIYVYDQLGKFVTLTSDGVAALAQPVTTDEFGFYTYWAHVGIYREDTWFLGKLRMKEIVGVGGAVGDLLALYQTLLDDVASAELAAATAEAAESGIMAAIAGVDLTNATLNAATRVILAALDHTAELPAYLTEPGREGLFKWDGSNLKPQCDADPRQGIYVPPTGGDGTTGAWVRVIGSPMHPEWWGAKGDGVTNDTVAFQQMANRLNALGGGVVDYAPLAVYIVGLQNDNTAAPVNFDGAPGGPVRYSAQQILVLTDLDGLVIRNNGAIMRAAPGLRVGSFNADGSAMASANGYQGVGAASPWGAMVLLTRVKNARVDLILDGNSENLLVGGPWGDTGYQVGGTGFEPIDCTHCVFNIVSCNNPGDGIQHVGACQSIDDPDEHIVYETAVAKLNGRNGLSLIGGKRVHFNVYDFSFNGKASETVANDLHVFKSAPGSGMDIECEGLREAHYITFGTGRFACNYGAAVLYAGGGASNITFDNYEIIGDINYSIYSASPFPDVHFKPGGKIIGLGLWQGTNGDGATIWDDVTWHDDAALSPTGVAYDAGPIMNFGGGGSSADCYLKECKMLLTGNATAPVGIVGMKFRDFTLEQANPTLTGFGGADFYGDTYLTGNFDMGGDVHINSTNNGLFHDRVTINGVEVSVKSQLLNFHGLRVRGYDGAAQHSYRVAMWSNPVDWAAQVGGANVGDVVIDTNSGVGFPVMSQCITAPGNAPEKWLKLGYKGETIAANVPALAVSGETVDSVAARVNQIINGQRAAHRME